MALFPFLCDNLRMKRGKRFFLKFNDIILFCELEPQIIKKIIIIIEID